MKFVCYVSSMERKDRFRQVFEELNLAVVHYDSTEVKSLVAFVQRGKTLHQQDCLMIDMDDVSWSAEHVVSAVQLLRRISPAELILLSSGGREELFGQLASMFHLTRGLVTGPHPEEELRRLLSPEAEDDDVLDRHSDLIRRALVTAAVQDLHPLSLEEGRTITLAVVGAMPRCGVTTQCFALYHALQSLGLKPAILDTEGVRTTELLGLYPEEAATVDGYHVIRGVSFTPARCPAFNVYVEDLGVLKPELTEPVAAADLVILVGGTKPWELPRLADSFARLYHMTARERAVILTLSSQEEQESVGKYLGDHWGCAPVRCDIWDAGDQEFYRSLLRPLLVPLCS